MSLADRFEDSDFGPVSKAVLLKQETKLRELIRLGYDPGEEDHCGWTALHLSVYWPLGMEILLAAGVQHTERVLGHSRAWVRERMTPLEYAFEKKQDETILLLLDTDSVLKYKRHHLLAQLMRYEYEVSSRVVTATIETMVQRSNRLRTLAEAHLSSRELDLLRISHEEEPIQILDAYATPTANALGNVGVKTPEALEPYWVNGTVYHEWYHFSPELADRLWSYGFHDTNDYDEDGFTLLHHACDSLELDMASWLMSHGGDPTTVVRNHSQNAFHLLANSVNDWTLARTMYDIVTDHLDIVSRIGGLCGRSCQDDCRCACSPQGCTPTSVLLRAATRDWCEKEDLFSSWCRFLDLSPDAIDICCLEFARMETFERLGITHVCCKIDFVNVAVNIPAISDPMPQDTIEEIQDEESEMIDQLKAFMTLYEKERADFQGSAIEFLGKWSDMLKDELDVPAPFEEYWTKERKKDRETRMAGYFNRPSVAL